MDLGLTGKVFVVTGGSRGLGLATVLVAEGARVVLAARTPTAYARRIDPRPVTSLDLSGQVR